MMRKFIITFAAVMIFLFSASTVFGQDYGLEQAARVSKLSEQSGPGQLPRLIGVVMGSLLSMMGILFFLLTLYGGFLWMTARGNEEQSRKALNTVIAAIIGIVIVIGAYAVTQFVLGSVESKQTGQVGKICATDTECGAGEFCSAGRCAKTTQCSFDEECARGQICVNNACQVGERSVNFACILRPDGGRCAQFTEQFCGIPNQSCAWDRATQKCVYNGPDCENRSESQCEGLNTENECELL